jgi:hypothetical protein
MTLAESQKIIQNLRTELQAVCELARIMSRHSQARDTVGKRVAELLFETIESVEATYR